MVVYTIDVRSIPRQPFGRETFSRREDAERFLDDIRKEDPDLASELRIEERELTSAGRSAPRKRSSSELRKVA